MVSEIITQCLSNLLYRKFMLNGHYCVEPLRESTLGEEAVKIIIETFTQAGFQTDALGRYVDENGNMLVNSQSSVSHFSIALPFSQPSLMSLAASRGDITLMAWLQSQGADLSRASHAHSTLHIAAERGHIEMIDFLHAAGLDINQPAHAEESDMYVGNISPIHTPLHRAIRFGSLVTVQHLLDLGAKLQPDALPNSFFEEEILAYEQQYKVLEDQLEKMREEHRSGIEAQWLQMLQSYPQAFNTPANRYDFMSRQDDEPATQEYKKLLAEQQALPPKEQEAHALMYAKKLLAVLSMNPYSHEYQHYFGHGHHRDFDRVPRISVLQEIVAELEKVERRIKRTHYALPLFQFVLTQGTPTNPKTSIKKEALFDANALSVTLDIAAGPALKSKKRKKLS